MAPLLPVPCCDCIPVDVCSVSTALALSWPMPRQCTHVSAVAHCQHAYCDAPLSLEMPDLSEIFTICLRLSLCALLLLFPVCMPCTAFSLRLST